MCLTDDTTSTSTAALRADSPPGDCASRALAGNAGGKGESTARTISIGLTAVSAIIGYAVLANEEYLLSAWTVLLVGFTYIYVLRLPAGAAESRFLKAVEDVARENNGVFSIAAAVARGGSVSLWHGQRIVRELERCGVVGRDVSSDGGEVWRRFPITVLQVDELATPNRDRHLTGG